MHFEALLTNGFWYCSFVSHFGKASAKRIKCEISVKNSVSHPSLCERRCLISWWDVEMRAWFLKRIWSCSKHAHKTLQGGKKQLCMTHTWTRATASALQLFCILNQACIMQHPSVCWNNGADSTFTVNARSSWVQCIVGYSMQWTACLCIAHFGKCSRSSRFIRTKQWVVVMLIKMFII